MRKATAEKASYAPEISVQNQLDIQRWINQEKKVPEIAELLGISYRHAQGCVRRLKKSSIVEKRSNCGRKKKIDDLSQSLIFEKVMEDRFVSKKKLSLELKDKLSLEISPKTVGRAVKNMGLKARSPRMVPLMSAANRKRRRELAEDFLMKPMPFWDRVIWSDETKINFFRSDGKNWVWRFAGEAYDEKCTLKTVKHGGGSLMLWGCMSTWGVGKLVIIDGTLTAVKYVQLLQENLFESASRMGLGTNFVFQQDNDPKHTARLTKRFFEENHIEVLPWPAQSPDLNVIEHMWAELKRRYGLAKVTAKAEIISTIFQIWEDLGKEYALKLSRSMYNRFRAVINSNGGSSGY